VDNEEHDKQLRVRFIHIEGDWTSDGRGFLPNALFFRLVSAVVSQAGSIAGAFENMYADRIVIDGKQRYMLQYDRAEQQLRLVVYGQDAAAPAAVKAALEMLLSEHAGSFGVRFRFEAEALQNGQTRYRPLDELQDHEAGKLWQQAAAGKRPREEEDHAAQSNKKPHPGSTDAPSAPLAKTFAVKPMAERKYDVFINHCQASGQDQAKTLSLLLQIAGLKVWYDMQAQDLTAHGMEEGVADSRCVLMFLSDDLMGRPFCHAEQRWGKLYNCKFVGIVEKDNRHSPADFGKEKQRAPADLKDLLDKVEFIEYRRRDFEEKAMVQELVRRIRQ